MGNELNQVDYTKSGDYTIKQISEKTTITGSNDPENSS